MVYYTYLPNFCFLGETNGPPIEPGKRLLPVERRAEPETRAKLILAKVLVKKPVKKDKKKSETPTAEVCLQFSMTSVVEYQYWVYKIRMKFA